MDTQTVGEVVSVRGMDAKATVGYPSLFTKKNFDLVILNILFFYLKKINGPLHLYFEHHLYRSQKFITHSDQ